MLQDLPFTDLQVARERLDRWLSLAIAFANESQPFARDERQWMTGMLFWDAGRRRLGDEWSDPIRPLFVELAAVRDRPVRVGDIIAASASQTLVQVDNRLRLWLITCGFHKWLDAAIVLTESTLRRELILGDNDDFMGLSWALSVSWRQEPIDFPDPQWRRVAERLRTDSPFWEAGAAVQAENFAKHVRETLDLDPWQMGAELDLEFSKASQRRLAVDANPPSKSEPQAIYLGNRQCRVGDGQPEDVTRAEQKAGYLGILMDENQQVIGRVGYTDSVDLSRKPKLWKVFLSLYRARGAYRSLKEIHDDVYGTEDVRESGTVKSHLSRLKSEIRALRLDLGRRDGDTGWRLVDMQEN